MPSRFFAGISRIKLTSAGIYIARIDGRHPELEIKDGTLAVPDLPGFGVELDTRRVAPFLWAEYK